MTLLGSLQNGVAVLSSYVFSSGQSGTFTASGNANETDTGSAQDSASGSNSGNQCASLGSVSSNLLASGSFTASDSYSFTSTDSSSSTDSGGFTDSLYQTGVFTSGSYSLGCVVLGSSDNDYETVTDYAASTDSGIQTSTQNGNGQSGATMQIGGGSFSNLALGTSSESVSGTFGDSSYVTTTSVATSQEALVELGYYGHYSFSFGTVTDQALGSANYTVQESDSSSFTGSGKDTYTDSANATANGSYAISTNSANATANDTGTDSYSLSSSDTVTQTVTASDSYNAYSLGSRSSAAVEIDQRLFRR